MLSVLGARQSGLSPAQGARLRAVLRRSEAPERPSHAPRPARKTDPARAGMAVPGPGKSGGRKPWRGLRKEVAK